MRHYRRKYQKARKPIGVVLERRMGLFRNIAPSLVLIAPIKNVNRVTVILHEAV